MPNGYAFTVDGKEYMCFSAEQLVSEVFVRLAVEKLDYMHKEMVAGVLEAVVRWKDIKSAMMANAELIASARRAHASEATAIRALAKATERAETFQKERDRLWDENVKLRLDIDHLERRLKKFDRLLVGGNKRK